MSYTISVRYARVALWLFRSMVLAICLSILLLGLRFANAGFSGVRRVDAQARTINTSLEARQLEELFTWQQSMQTTIDDFASSHEGTFGIVVHDLKSGNTFSHGEQQRMRSASLYKTFMVYEALRQLDAGTVSLDDPFTKDRTLGGCLEIAITKSDNPCGKELQKRFAAGATQNLPGMEIEQTDLHGVYPTTTAADIAKLFENIYHGTGLSSSSHDLLLRHLENQQITPRLPALLPEDARVLHKTGDLDDVSHDAGIILAEKPYVIVVMTDEWEIPQPEKDQAVARLSADIYELMNR